MANYVLPLVFINYISLRKKICVNRANQPTQLIIQTDYYLNETYNFQIINAINQIVLFDNATTYLVYGSYIDAKKQMHILFYTPNYVIKDNILSFTINTYTKLYLDYVKENRTPIDISIVAKKGNNSYMVLRDIALANPRALVEDQVPTDIVYRNIFNDNVPVTGSFGAGNNINLAQDFEGQEIASFAFGDTLTTSNANQFVIGYNNEPDAEQAFIIANSGNIFTVDYEGNVKAGDLDVGAISATSLTVSGEDINSLVDDKVEYLSTSIDDKLSATEDWVSNTFETKDAATKSYNSLAEDINDISAAITGLTDNIVLTYATKTELNTTSGVLDDKIDLVSAAIPTGNAQLENTAGYITGYVDTTYSADDDTLKLVGTQFSIKSLESVLAAGDDGITLDTVDGVTYIYNTGSGSGGGESDKTYTAGTGLTGVSVTSSIIRFDIKTDWLTQFIEDTTSGVQNLSAGTGLKIEDNVISISASYLSSDALNGYATQDWVTNTALADNATQTWVTDEISGKADQTDVDYISAFVSGLPQDISELNSAMNEKADKEALLELSGTVEDITVPTKVSELENDIPYLSAITSADIPTSYVQQSQLEDYATVESLTAYTEKTDFDTVTGGFENRLTAIEADYTTSGQAHDIASAYVDTLNIATTYATKESLDELSGATSGLPSRVEALETATGSYASNEDLQAVSGAVTGTVEDINYLSSVITGKVDNSSLENYYTSTQVDTITGQLSSDLVAELSGDDDTTYSDGRFISISGDANTINCTLTGLSQLENDTNFITLEDVPPGSVYGVGFGLAASGDSSNIFYLTGTVLSGSDSITVENNVISLTNASNYIKSGDNVSLLTNDAGYITDSALVGYATEQLLSTTSATLTGQINDLATGAVATNTASIETLTGKVKTIEDDYTTSGQVSSIVEGYGYQTASDVSNAIANSSATIIDGLATTGYVDSAVSSKANSADVYTKQEADAAFLTATTQIPTAISDLTNDSLFATSAQVSAIVEGYDFAEASDIPTTVAELTDSSDYALKTDLPTVATLSTGMVEATSATIRTGLATTDAISAMATTGWVSEQGYLTEVPNTYALKTDVETASGAAVVAATGWVDGQGYLTEVPNTYALKTDIPTDYTTSAQVSAIASGYDTTYKAGTGLALSSDNETFYLTASIPTSTSQLTNNSNYLSSVTIKQWDNDQQLQLTYPVSSIQFGDYFDVSDNGNNDVYVEWKGLTITDYEDYSNTVSEFVYNPEDFFYNDDRNGLQWNGFSVDNTSGDYSSNRAKSIILSNDFIIFYDQNKETECTISLNANILTSYTTSAQVSSIVEGYGYQTAAQVSAIASGYDTTYTAGTGLKLDGTEFSLTATIPTNADISGIASSVTLSYGYQDAAQVSGIVLSYGYQTANDVSGIVEGMSSTIIDGLATTGYVDTAISNINIPTKLSEFNNDVGFITLDSISEIGGVTSAQVSAIVEGYNYTTSAQVSSIVEGYGYQTAAQVSAIASGYVSGPTNKQVLSTVNSNQITYDETVDIFKTTYTGSTLTLNTVTVPAGSLNAGEVATFEEWITTNNDIPSADFSAGSNIFVGEIPSALLSSKTHVFTRRLVNNGGTITQFVSFAYEF